DWGQIIKLSLDGDLIWQRRHQHATDGFVVFNYLVDAVELDEGGYIAVGGRNDVETGENLWIIRLDEDGCLEEDCGTINVEEHHGLSLDIFEVSPIPAHKEIIISLKDNADNSYVLDQKFEIALTDLSGKAILNDSWIEGAQNMVIKIEHFSPGNYLLKIGNESGQVYLQRVVKI
ncbi:MAG: T9SS type A sorting domain-containing protein, partial [Flavobacteriales bacterium]|nr:T9SS type A sorting domain-containing protein [Flavobacteriales bacterium]